MHLETINHLLLSYQRCPIPSALPFEQFFEKSAKLVNSFSGIFWLTNLVFGVSFIGLSFLTTMVDDKKPGIPSALVDTKSTYWELLVFNLYFGFGSIGVVLQTTCSATVIVTLLKIQEGHVRYIKYLLIKMFDYVKSDELLLSEAKTVEVRRQLRWWVGVHQKLMQALDELQSAVAPVITYNYLECITNNCVGIFLVHVESVYTPLQIIIANGIGGSMVVETYLSSYLADSIYHETSSLTQGAYTSELFKFPKPMRLNMKIILERGRTPFQIKGFGFLAISSAHFLQVVNTCASYYLTLQNFKDRIIDDNPSPN